MAEIGSRARSVLEIPKQGLTRRKNFTMSNVKSVKTRSAVRVVQDQFFGFFDNTAATRVELTSGVRRRM